MLTEEHEKNLEMSVGAEETESTLTMSTDEDGAESSVNMAVGDSEAESDITMDTDNKEVESNITQSNDTNYQDSKPHRVDTFNDIEVENDATIGGTLRAHKIVVPLGEKPIKDGKDIYSSGAAYEYSASYLEVDDALKAQGIIGLTIVNADGKALGRKIYVDSGASDIVLKAVKDLRKISQNDAQDISNAAISLLQKYVDKEIKRATLTYLSKTTPDTAQQLITFLKGIAFKNDRGIDGEGNAILKTVIAESFKSTDFKESGTLLDGKGFGMYTDATGATHLAVDIIEARKKATFAQLEVKEFSFTSGDTGYTSAGAKIDYVRKTDNNCYRCYFLAENDDARISNDFHVGDQAMARTGNIISKTTQMAQNRYYWRLVVGVDSTPVQLEDGKTYHYIDLSDVKGSLTLHIGGKDYLCVGYDTSAPNDEPKAGDSVVQLGSQTDPNRRYAYIIYVSTGKRVTYSGINDYDLDSHIIELRSAEKNFILSDYFQVLSSSGTGKSSPLVCNRGEWPKEGAVSGHYDRWVHNNATWLCIVGKGKTTTSEPKDGSPEWLKETYGESSTELKIFTDRGNIIRNGQGSVVLTAVVTRGDKEITDTFPVAAFSWTRNSGNEAYDTEWNNRHIGVGKTITVNASDIFKRAVFECILDN